MITPQTAPHLILKRVLDEHTADRLCFSPDETLLVVNLQDAVVLFSGDDLRRIADIPCPAQPRRMRFSPDSARLAIHLADHTVLMCDRDGAILARIPAWCPEHGIGIALSARWLVTRPESDTLSLWSLADLSAPADTVNVGGGEVEYLLVSPEAETIVYGWFQRHHDDPDRSTGALQWWRRDGDRLVNHHRSDAPLTFPRSAIALSATHLLSADPSRPLSAFRSASGKSIGTARVWRLSDNEMILPHVGDDEIDGAVFSADGAHLIGWSFKSLYAFSGHGKTLHTTHTAAHIIRSVTLSDDEVVVCTDHDVTWLSLPDLSVRQCWTAEDEETQCVRATTSRAAMLESGWLTLRDRDGHTLARIEMPIIDIEYANLTSDGAVIRQGVLGRWELWDVLANTCLRLPEEEEPIGLLSGGALVRCGDRLVSLDAAKEERWSRPLPDDEAVISICPSRERLVIATSREAWLLSADGTEQGILTVDPRLASQTDHHIRFSQDGTQLLWTWPEGVAIWDVVSQRRLVQWLASESSDKDEGEISPIDFRCSMTRLEDGHLIVPPLSFRLRDDLGLEPVEAPPALSSASHSCTTHHDTMRASGWAGTSGHCFLALFRENGQPLWRKHLYWGFHWQTPSIQDIHEIAFIDGERHLITIDDTNAVRVLGLPSILPPEESAIEDAPEVPPEAWLLDVIAGFPPAGLRTVTRPEVSPALFESLYTDQLYNNSHSFKRASTAAILALLDPDIFGWDADTHLRWAVALFSAFSTVYFGLFSPEWEDISGAVQKLDGDLDDAALCAALVADYQQVNPHAFGVSGSLQWKEGADGLRRFLEHGLLSLLDRNNDQRNIFWTLEAQDRAHLKALSEAMTTACTQSAGGAPTACVWVNYHHSQHHALLTDRSTMVIRTAGDTLALHTWYERR